MLRSTTILTAAFLLVTALVGNAAELLNQGFESGTFPGASTWSCSGVTYNVVGSGFLSPLVDQTYPFTGAYSLHLRKASGAGKSDLLVLPLTTTGSIHMSFNIRPFIASSPTHALIVGVAENSPAVTESRALCAAAHFGGSGTLQARSPGYPVLGFIPRNQWYQVQLDINLDTDRYAITCTGPGVSLSATNLPFEMPCDHVNYLVIYCDTPVFTEHAIDDLRIWDDYVPPETVACEPYFEDFSTQPTIEDYINVDGSDAYYVNLPYLYDLGDGCTISWDFCLTGGAFGGLGQSSVMGPRYLGETFPRLRFNYHYDNASAPTMSLSYPTAPLQKDPVILNTVYHAAVTRVGQDAARLTVKDSNWLTVVDYTIPAVWAPFEDFQLCYDYYTGDQGKCEWDAVNQRISFLADRSPGLVNYVAGWIDNLRIGAGNVAPVNVQITDPCSPADLTGFTVRVTAGNRTWEDDTDAAGQCVFAEVPLGEITVAVLPRDGFYPLTGASKVVQHQAETDLTFEFQPAVNLTGVVSGCNGGLQNVTVALVDGTQVSETTFTDAQGQFAFEGVAPGAGNLSITVPLGYRPDTDGDAIPLVLSCDMEQDFTLACVPASGIVRSMGYWKHQAQVFFLQRGSAQETLADVTVNFPNLIFHHFYENLLNSIAVDGITYMGSPGDPSPINLQTMYGILWVPGKASMVDRARQQYLATMLNVASGKLLVDAVVSNDGKTTSQAIQYIADLINDQNPANDELAKNLAESLNLGVQIGAGVIPAEYETIHYRQPQEVSRVAGLLLKPNPFTDMTRIGFDLPASGDVKITVYDAAGRLVADIGEIHYAAGRHEVSWDGTDNSGRKVPGGIYYLNTRTGQATRSVPVVVSR